MIDLETFLKLFDTFGIIAIIFLTGSAFQRLKHVEDFIKNNKKFQTKVLVVETEVEGIQQTLREIKRVIETIRENCFKRHQGE